MLLNLSTPPAPRRGTPRGDPPRSKSWAAATRPVLSVLNKCDAAADPPPGPSLRISAKTGEGLDELLRAIAAALPPDRRRVKLLFPFSQGALAKERCRREGAVEAEEYTPEGLAMTATLGVRLLDAARAYIVEDRAENTSKGADMQ